MRTRRSVPISMQPAEVSNSDAYPPLAFHAGWLLQGFSRPLPIQKSPEYAPAQVGPILGTEDDGHADQCVCDSQRGAEADQVNTQNQRPAPLARITLVSHEPLTPEHTYNTPLRHHNHPSLPEPAYFRLEPTFDFELGEYRKERCVNP